MDKVAGLAVMAILFCLFACTDSIHSATRYVRGVPNCGHTQYDGHGNLYLFNSCDITVTITFTNERGGPVWGTTKLAPGERQQLAGMGMGSREDNGEIYLYPCPGDSTPIDPNGKAIGSRYHGPYSCVVYN